jgi:hypothetical protein
MPDWFDGNGTGGKCDVVALLDSAAGEMITQLVSTGALVSLGVTSDGGALALTVTVDGRWRREYFREVEPLELWLTEAVPAVRAAIEARPASSAPRSRQRGSRAL